MENGRVYMTEPDDPKLDEELAALYRPDGNTGFRDRVMRRIAHESAAVEAVTDERPALRGDEKPKDLARHVARRHLLTLVGGFVATAAIFLALTLRTDDDGIVPTANRLILERSSGTVHIFAVDGRQREPRSGANLQPGDTIRTSGESSATVIARDGSRLTLTRDSSLTWPDDEQGSLRLNSGLASIVRRPKNNPTFVVFKTQHATVEAPDSELILATSDRQTDVTVKRGDARVTCRNGKTAKVNRGECGVAKKQAVTVRTGASTPDEWNEDFESGVPTGYVAEFVGDNLPQGSNGAATTQLSRDEESDTKCHQFWTHSDWEHGLAVIHEDTHLNFIYRLDKPESVITKLNLRSPFPDSPKLETQLLHINLIRLKERWWNVPEGQWYRVSLPVSRFRKFRSKTDGPTPSSIVVSVAMRPRSHESALLIDRMWLSRGGSNDVEFEPFEGNGIESEVPKP